MVPVQITTRWQELAAARWPNEPIVGDGPLAVLTANGGVRLFNALPMHEPGSDFDARFLCLVADPRNHMYDLRDYKEPPKSQPKVEAAPVRKVNVVRLWRIPGDGIDE
jgi:hypothetical protein